MFFVLYNTENTRETSQAIELEKTLKDFPAPKSQTKRAKRGKKTRKESEKRRFRNAITVFPFFLFFCFCLFLFLFLLSPFPIILPRLSSSLLCVQVALIQYPFPVCPNSFSSTIATFQVLQCLLMGRLL